MLRENDTKYVAFLRVEVAGYQKPTAVFRFYATIITKYGVTLYRFGRTG